MATTVITTFGTIAGYSVTLGRRPAVGGDAGFTAGRATSVLAVALSNGTNTYEALVMDDDPVSSGALRAAGLAIINAFAAIGGSTALGTAGQTPATASSVTGNAPYAKAVPLTPGTPLPPGRGVIVKGSGNFVLKLQGGGTVTVGDPTGGAGTRHDGFAVIDADVTGAGTGATVQILY